MGRVRQNKDMLVFLTLKGANTHLQQEFIQAIFAPVAQGYGATETAACATVQECFAGGKWPTNPEDKHMFGPARVPDERPADKGGGRVGAIQPANEIKLLSVEEMGYLVTDSPPRGEILVVNDDKMRKALHILHG